MDDNPALALEGTGFVESNAIPEYSSNYNICRAQSDSHALLLALASGTLVLLPGAVMALDAYAQNRVTGAVMPPHDATSAVPGFETLGVGQYVTAALRAASRIDAVVDDLGLTPLFVPLFKWYSADSRNRAWATVICASQDPDSAPLLLNVPRSMRKDDSAATPAATNLCWRVYHALWRTDPPQLAVDCGEGLITAGRLAVRSRVTVVWPTGDPTVLLTLFCRLHAVPGMSAVSAPPHLLLPPVPRRTKKGTHRRDAVIPFWRALLGNPDGEPGAGLHDGKHGRAIRKGLQIMVARSPRPDAAPDPHADWLSVKLDRLQNCPGARVDMPASAALACSTPEHVGVHRVPSDELAATFHAYTMERLRSADVIRRAAAAGGASAAAAPAHPVALESVRGATDADLVAASMRRDEQGLGDVPAAMSPCQVFACNGLERALPHVLFHTPLEPSRLQVPLERASSVEGCSLDFDGCGINFRHCPSPLIQEFRAALTHAASTAPPRAVPPPAGEFAAALHDCVMAHAHPDGGTAVANVASAAGLLRRSASLGTARLAHASAATVLAQPSPAVDARAAVRVVLNHAALEGVLGLWSLLVHVPSSGAPELTRQKPTVDAGFIAKAPFAPVLLPGPVGLDTEPFRVIVVGATHSQVACAIRDVLAAFVEEDAAGSTGVARSTGLAARAPTDTVVVGGGALVPLAILVLLLVRHAHEPRHDGLPFACLKVCVAKCARHPVIPDTTPSHF